jgi:hypothetical protein
MNTNIILSKIFTKTLKKTAQSYAGEFKDLVTATLSDPTLLAKSGELLTIVTTDRQIAALREQKKALLASTVAKTKPMLVVDGRPVKRPRGRPRKSAEMQHAQAA